jgi:hypothetical protein
MLKLQKLARNSLSKVEVKWVMVDGRRTCEISNQKNMEHSWSCNFPLPCERPTLMHSSASPESIPQGVSGEGESELNNISPGERQLKKVICTLPPQIIEGGSEQSNRICMKQVCAECYRDRQKGRRKEIRTAADHHSFNPPSCQTPCWYMSHPKPFPIYTLGIRCIACRTC